MAMMIHSFPISTQDEVMWMFGGQHGQKSDGIFKLVCHSKPTNAGSCEWKSVAQKLKIPRSVFGSSNVIALP